jgi:hypothetical protein
VPRPRVEPILKPRLAFLQNSARDLPILRRCFLGNSYVLLQPRVLRFSGLQDGDVGVGVFPGVEIRDLAYRARRLGESRGGLQYMQDVEA